MTDRTVLTGHLATKRRAVGHNTPIGHVCSNLMELLPALPTYVRQEWASHPSQTLQWRMARQLERLAATGA